MMVCRVPEEERPESFNCWFMSVNNLDIQFLCVCVLLLVYLWLFMLLAFALLR
jgi:hypothetical protein